MDVQEQLRKVARGAVTLVSEGELVKKLSSGRKLRVKLGVDPTSADLHLGHSVVLQKLRAFQDLGHTAVLLIGDFTALVGDPSGRDATRPTLTPEAIAANARTYQDQAFKILDPAKTELRFNSEWLKPFVAEGLLDVLKRQTVQQVLAREDFKQRIKDNSPLTMLETLYPIFQGYDSVALKADVELGGNDQLTNLLMGRRLQQDAGQEAQVALTVPLLVGMDGVQKMSKSYGNSIAFNDSPREIFGKVMRITDETMLSYYELLTGEDLEGVKAKHPMDAKKALAETLAARFHGEAAGREERRFFEETFSKKALPTEIPGVTFECGKTFSELIVRCDATKSKNEARRLIQQGGVKLDGAKLPADGPVAKEPATFVLQVGKHQFFKVTVCDLAGKVS